jgi:hypothetical protein
VSRYQLHIRRMIIDAEVADAQLRDASELRAQLEATLMSDRPADANPRTLPSVTDQIASEISRAVAVHEAGGGS